MSLTVAIATFNAAPTIRACLESIINQKTHPAELIITDGGSTDGTTNLCRSILANAPFTWKLTSEPDLGIADAFNKSINRASGKWIHIIGADDKYLDSESIGVITRECVESFESVLFFQAHLESSDGKIHLRQPFVSKVGLEQGMTVIHPATVVRADVYRKVGEFCLDFKIAMDYEFLLRVQSRMTSKQFKVVPKSVIQVGYGGESHRRRGRGYREVLAAQLIYTNRKTFSLLAMYLARRFFFTTVVGSFLWRYLKLGKPLVERLSRT